MGWDSNPRDAFTYTRFPSVLLKPLGHPSKWKDKQCTMKRSFAKASLCVYTYITQSTGTYMCRIILFIFAFLFPFLSAHGQHTNHQIVAVTVEAYAGILEDLLQGIAEVHVCVPNGISAHTWEPKPKDTIRLQKAILWFGTGEPFEAKLVPLLQEQNCMLRFVDLREGLETIHDGCTEHTHAIDPHIWMSPKLLLQQLTCIENELKVSFPERADEIEKRANKIRKTLIDLDSYIRRTLEDHQGALIIVSHGAYSYFCKEYNLVQLAIEKEGKELTIQELNELVERAKKQHVHTILIQKQYPSKAAKQISKQIGCTLQEVDPYSKNYFKSMLDITKAIHDEAHRQNEHSTSPS